MSSTMAPNMPGLGAPGRRMVYSICSMCSVRCPIEVTVEDGHVVWLQGNSHDKAIGELIDWIAANVSQAEGVDAEDLGLVGFSAGGLATLLAADDPRVRVWVGLDPVDVAGKGVGAARR